MIIRKCLKVPVHYDTTESKIYILDRLTARITYGISLISSFVTSDTKLDRPTLRKIARDGDIASKTGLSAGFVDRCVDKVLWSWKSYKALHNDWERKADRAREKIENARDDKEKANAQKSHDKRLKREPSEPTFETKTPCRIDSRTGRIEKSADASEFPLWLHISTLRKRETIDVPLNPSQYHLKQLEDAEINDFEIVQKKKKYYVHISISREIPDKKPSSIGGIDQGLNRTIAVVLLPLPETDGAIPQRELILDSDKRDLIDKYDLIIASCQESGTTKKLKQLRNKRSNVALYHDWCLAKQVAEVTEDYYIAIGKYSYR